MPKKMKGRYFYLKCKLCNHTFRYHAIAEKVEALLSGYSIRIECPSCHIKGLHSRKESDNAK